MRHYSAESLPRLWWLSPWSTCREMHGMLRAFQQLAEVDDQANQILKADVRYLTVENNSNHARWLMVLEENEALRSRIAELEAAVISGGAIVPDARPVQDDFSAAVKLVFKDQKDAYEKMTGVKIFIWNAAEEGRPNE